MGYVLDNWIALISLAIALSGGIPGIVAVVRHCRERPVFNFALVNMITGTMASFRKATERDADQPPQIELPDGIDLPDGTVISGTSTMVLITGTAANSGTKPLVPAYFELEARVQGKWIPFDKQLIRPPMQFHSDDQDIDMQQPWQHDLQTLTGPIGASVPIYGHLLFTTNKIDLETLRAHHDDQIRLTCVDVFGKRHATTIEHPRGTGEITAATMYPKHGLAVVPKHK